MIKNEINAHNAALLSNQSKAENLKSCLEEVYIKIKNQTSKGENSLLFFYIKPLYQGNNYYTGEIIWIITNILMSQGYSIEQKKDGFYSYIKIMWRQINKNDINRL